MSEKQAARDHADQMRLAGDDTAWLQWHIDNRDRIPLGTYRTTAPLVVDNDGALKMDNTTIVATGSASPAIKFLRPIDDRDYMAFCKIFRNGQILVRFGFEKDAGPLAELVD